MSGLYHGNSGGLVSAKISANQNQSRKSLQAPFWCLSLPLQLLNLIAWGLSLAMMCTVVFGLFHYFQGHQIPLFWRAAYSALSKPAWALGLTWITVSCYYGYGGPINSFMSWNIWVPLGKLSYTAYLIHAPIIGYLFGLENNAILFSGVWQTIINFYIPVVIVSFFGALIVSALVEIPTTKVSFRLISY